jgi:hypothetical protein
MTEQRSKIEGLEAFTVNSLNLGSVTDEDLAPAAKTSFPGFLQEPGIYDLTITQRVLSPKLRPDAAGNNWGSLMIVAEDNNTKKLVKGFIDVPIDSLEYTAKSGKTNTIKTQIFTRLASSLTGGTVRTADLKGVIENIGELAKPGTSFKARVGFKRDRVSYVGDSESGDALYGIILVDGTRMLGSDGAEASFADRDSASAYYQSVNGHNPAAGMDFISFLSTRAKEEVA